MSPALPCPCGLPATHGACCGRYHAGLPAHGLSAPSAEALMRSRYSAFVLGLNDYLLATWHSSTRPATLGPNEPGLRWLGLQVKRAWPALPADAPHGAQPSAAQEAFVEFVVRSKLGGRAHRLHEISRFVREGGRWFYVDGVMKSGA
jgi:SEC-C motif-containing protein